MPCALEVERDLRARFPTHPVAARHPSPRGDSDQRNTTIPLLRTRCTGQWRSRVALTAANTSASLRSIKRTPMSTFIIDVPMPAMGATVSELTIINIVVAPGRQGREGPEARRTRERQVLLRLRVTGRRHDHRGQRPEGRREVVRPVAVPHGDGRRKPAAISKSGTAKGRLRRRPSTSAANAQLGRPWSGPRARRNSHRRPALIRPRSPTSKRPARATASPATTCSATSRIKKAERILPPRKTRNTRKSELERASCLRLSCVSCFSW